jgi:Ca2+-binding EF-hand superfamily protein
LAIFAPPVAAAAQSNPAAPAAQPVTKAALSSQIDASFARLDSNGDKSLNTAEIDAAQKRQVAEAQGVINKRLETEFTKLDGNKDGQLSLAEFKAAAPTPKTATPAELLGQLDKNKDGKVTHDEFRSGPLANFDRIDTNKDGTISEAERSAATKQR